MHLKIFFFLLLFFSKNLNGQDVGLDWVYQFGGNGYDAGLVVTVDSGGNVFAMGEFQSIVDFDPGAGEVFLTSLNIDGYIQKLDTDGNLAWVKRTGGSSGIYNEDMVMDQSGNFYILGIFEGTVDFDASGALLNKTAVGTGDIFIQKLDSNGNFLWVKQIGGLDISIANSIAVDTSGNIYLTGLFYGSIDLDPGIGVVNFVSSGGADSFVLKLNSTGDFLWGRQFSSSSSVYGTSIITDISGNVYAGGDFYGTVDFDPGAGINNLTATSVTDIYIQKMDANGNFIWAQRFGGLGDDNINSMAIDSLCNVYCTGNYYSGTKDIFVLKLDSSGTVVWERDLTDISGHDTGRSIAIDTGHNVYVSGTFRFNSDFDPGPNIVSVTSNGEEDIFILKLSNNGNFEWVKQMGSIEKDYSYSCAIDKHGNVYTTGVIQDTIDMNPGTDTLFFVSSGGNKDIYIQKLQPCTDTYATDVKVACESYTWIDGITYYASNDSAVYVIGNAAGCDSIITLDLTINNMVFGFDSIVTCGPYTWIDGITYTASTNTPSYFLYGGSIAGCDSIATLHLTIIDSAISIDSYNECDALTWLDGNTYTSSNSSAFIVLPGASFEGCDSTIFLDLTIEPIDVTVSQTDQVTFTANATNATYQWLNCDNGFAPIVGETNQTFIASDNGNYAVEITNTNNCSDTSICYTVAGLSIQTVNPFAGVSIYPNPTNGLVNIDFKNGQNVSISVFNALGQLVFTKQNIKEGTTNFELTGAPGVYTVEVNIDGQKQNYKVVKEK